MKSRQQPSDNRHTHKLAGMLTAAGMLLVLWVSVAYGGDEIALVRRGRGAVSVGYEHDSTRFLAETGFLLSTGARVETGVSGYAQVRFVNSRTTLVLCPRSVVVIRQDDEPGFSRKSIDIVDGSVALEIQEVQGEPIGLFMLERVGSSQYGRLLISVSREDTSVTIYSLSGQMQLANRSLSLWHDITAPAAATVPPGGLFQSDSLSASERGRLAKVFEDMRSLRGDFVSVWRLHARAEAGGAVYPDQPVATFAGVGADIRALPDPPAVFAGWDVVSGSAVFEDVSAESTRVVLSTDAVIEAQFSRDPSRLSIMPSENGLVSPNGAVFVEPDASVQLRVAPDKGYRFAGFTRVRNAETITESDSLVVVRLTGSSGRVTPLFERKKYRLTVTANEYGTTEPLEPVELLHGDSLQIRAKPVGAAGFVGWKIISGHARIAHPRSAVTTVVCDSLDAHIAAQFSPRAVPVVIEAPEGITVTPSGEFLAGVGDTLSITVERTGAYGVKSWEVTEGRATVHGREAATVVCREPFTIRPVIGPRTYEITLGAGEGGTVGRAGSRRTIHGDPVVLQAHPARNMHFVRWRRRAGFCFIEDDQADSTVAVLTRGDAAVWGEFAAQVCTLDITATSGGHTEPAGIVKAARGSSQLLRAIPNPDAAFLGWRIVESDDSLEFDDSLTVQELTLKNIPGNANIEAEFSTEAVDLTVLSNGLGRTEPSGERTVALRKWSSLKATPAPGQEFVEWTVLSGTGVEFRDRLQPDTQIRIAEGDAIVKALFQPGTGQAGTGHADSSVTVRFMWDPIMGSVDKGASVTVSGTDPVAVTAVPSAGYYFTGWKVRAGAPLITAPFSAGTTVLPGRSDVVLQAVFSPRPVGLLELEFRDHEGRRKTMNVQYR